MREILKFKPIFKSVIWGGNKIAQFKNIKIADDHIGESWELSPIPGSESIVSIGKFAGKSLPWMIQEYGDDIMGKRLMQKYAAFPLLIKFIDSSDDLSIQVHPDGELAQKRHNSAGKTEMWYSLEPAPGAYLYAAFSSKLSPETFKQHALDGSITDYLTKYNVKPGDTFYLPAGRIHSIGRGNFLLEVQEASDVTYRLYDYKRRDKEGKERDLHLEEAEEAINFDDVEKDICINPSPEPGKSEVLSSSPFFNVSLNNIVEERHFDFSSNDSFTIAVSTAGNFILDKGGQNINLNKGETALIPWSLPKLEVSGSGNLISIYVPSN